MLCNFLLLVNFQNAFSIASVGTIWPIPWRASNYYLRHKKCKWVSQITCFILKIEREQSHVLSQRFCAYLRYVWMKLINNTFISEIKQRTENTCDPLGSSTGTRNALVIFHWLYMKACQSKASKYLVTYLNFWINVTQTTARLLVHLLFIYKRSRVIENSIYQRDRYWKRKVRNYAGSIF